MFRLFEKALNPTEPPTQSQPPAGLIAFYWHFARQAKGLFVALFITGFIVALLDSAIPAFMGRIVTLVTSSKPETLWTRKLADAARHGGRAAGASPARADGAEPGQQPGDRGQRRQHDPLAEPLARGAPVLGILPERFCRPHRQPRDADRTRRAREPRRADHRRLVHPGLRHRGAGAARLRRPLAGAADRALVRRLHRACCACSCRACATAPKKFGGALLR